MRKSVSSPGPTAGTWPHWSYSVAAKDTSPWPDTCGGRNSLQWEGAHLGLLGEGAAAPTRAHSGGLLVGLFWFEKPGKSSAHPPAFLGMLCGRCSAAPWHLGTLSEV